MYQNDQFCGSCVTECSAFGQAQLVSKVSYILALFIYYYQHIDANTRQLFLGFWIIYALVTN